MRPTLLAEDTIMVTGEVRRMTRFEKGMPNAIIERDGQAEPDPILDDQSVELNLRDLGLVVISGCAHAGIVNTVLQAKRLTGQSRVHAVLGGFHLTGADFEPIVEETVDEFKKLAPQILVPMHCTGLEAINRFAEEFPSTFKLNSVGTKFVL